MTSQQSNIPVHDELELDLDQLGLLAMSGPAALPADRMRAVLGRALRVLRDVLAMHFDREEYGGYMSDALVANPALARRTEMLRGQHGALARRIDAIIERVDSDELVRIQDEIGELVGAIRLHEHGELGLLQGVLDEDLGEVD